MRSNTFSRIRDEGTETRGSTVVLVPRVSRLVRGLDTMFLHTVFLGHILTRKHITTMVLAFLFMLVGALYLLKNTGMLSDQAWDIAWPLILILLGSAMFFRSNAGTKNTCLPWCSCGSAHGKKGKEERRLGISQG